MRLYRHRQYDDGGWELNMDDSTQYLVGGNRPADGEDAASSYADQAVPERTKKVYQVPPGPGIAERLTAVQAARNPLLEAAEPLLRVLCDMPQQLSADAIALLRSILEQEVRIFHKLCEQANIRRDHMLGASYCLCTALDESAMQTAWANDNSESFGTWIANGLASNFHEDRKGGDKVYFLIGRLMTEPSEHLDLLEVIYRILSLGFEGRYRVAAGGHRQHEAIRLRLYTEITAQRGEASAILSPHWESSVQGSRRLLYDFPIWISTLILSLALFGFYGYTKYDLITRSAALEKKIIHIGRIMPLSAPHTLQLRSLLKGEIAAGKVSVDEDAHHSDVIFHGDDMFVGGKADVHASMQPLIGKIAAEIVKVPGRVTVIGYTDSTPIHSRVFASNQVLSEERATQVMQLLQAAGIPARRLEAIGRGASLPLADNRTVTGRAQNRRVEIHVAE
jgi:type VI secretion system protein ImpK